MAAFVIFNTSSGAIQGAYTISDASSAAALMTANTPTGASALSVDLDHAALNDQSGWQVVNGALVAIVPTDAQLLASAQATQSTTITNMYAAAITAPVAYMSTTFRCDTESQMILAHALTVYNQAGSTPAGFYFLDCNNAQVAMSLTQLQGLGTAVAAQYLAAFQKRVSLVEQIQAANTVAAVQAIVWS